MSRFFPFFAALLLAAASLPAAESLSLDRVILALKPDKDPDRMLAERRKLGGLLGALIGRPVEVIVPTSAAVILEGLKNGTIDLAYVSATEMLAIRDAGAGSGLLAGEINGRPYYRSYWVARKGAPYTKVEDLRGKPIAFSSRTSTSGFLVPMVDLQEKGLLESADPESFFGKGNVWYGIGYVSAIERVLSGEAEAAAVSYYVLDENKYLTSEQKAQLVKIADQGPVPTHVIAASSKLSAADRDLLKAALLKLGDAEESVSAEIFSAKLVEVDDSAHLAPIEKALKLLGRRNP